MFAYYSLLATVSLALSAAAIPVTLPAGQPVPIRRRAKLTTDDGIFDHDRAIQLTVLTQNKHRQNLVNLIANVGESALRKVNRIARSIKCTHSRWTRVRPSKMSRVFPCQ